ncbi:hypothetical protein M5362_00485 [Streptomyces sp. Je 1-79]|uniref:hypothetical protein n=1 Tax=Streptomyces sp. Je 1-79 TaxID=2943847 RepID=UPI0021A50FB4|nr:hypothetical protein [Streptomyces sp. Je 1-79]MCT4351609.1 hypothetical protein [Streptomyces sp. Je 1-79]
MDVTEANDGSPGPDGPGDRRRAARRAVASRTTDPAELAEFLDILDLRPEVDHLYSGQESGRPRRSGEGRPGRA